MTSEKIVSFFADRRFTITRSKWKAKSQLYQDPGGGDWDDRPT